MTLRPGSRALLSVLSFAAATAAVGAARADEYQLAGNVYALYAARVRAVSCARTPSCRLPLAEERLQLKLSGSSESTVASSFLATVDLIADHVDETSRISPREIYADLSWNQVTLRAGNQIVTWGIGDYVFVNDVFPKNWESFFLGRPAAYLKEPSPALQLTVPHVDLVVLPTFQPDVFPSPARFAVADPFPPDIPRVFETPARKLENIEAALRVSANLFRWDTAVYAYRGFHRSPAFRPTPPDDMPPEILFHYPRLNTAGASIQGPLLGGLLGLEGAYYDSEDDRSGRDPFIQNSEVRGLAGYSLPLWEDAAVGVQALFQGMMKHRAYRRSLAAGMDPLPEARWTGTFRFTQLLLRQTLQFNLFTFVGLTQRDAYLVPSLRYSVTDALAVDLAGNLFLGDETGFFGQLERNSNARLSLQYGF